MPAVAVRRREYRERAKPGPVIVKAFGLGNLPEILADEVGLGKTFVALAVIASVVQSTRLSGKPVVVMVPPGLARKWPREWDQFKALCCTRPDALAWVRDKYVSAVAEALLGPTSMGALVFLCERRRGG